MNKDQIIVKLSEWKEKILFGVVVLATLGIAMQARPLSGSLVVDADIEQREAALKRTGVDREAADAAVLTLRTPPDWSPVQVDNLYIERPFYDDEDVFRPSKPSAWRLSQASYETLPPLTLSPPGFTQFPDYDLPAGPHPGLSEAGAFIPRDARPVTLATPGSSEFD